MRGNWQWTPEEWKYIEALARTERHCRKAKHFDIADRSAQALDVLAHEAEFCNQGSQLLGAGIPYFAQNFR